MTLLRSLLFVPANVPRRVEKALGLDADAVLLDLEDACPVAEKVAARGAVAAALGRPRRSALYVRINGLTTELAYGDLMAVVRPGLDGIMLPKVDGPDALGIADWLIAQLERERGIPAGSIDLLPLIETAAGVAALPAIARASPRVKRLAFGAADLAVELGLDGSRDEAELVPYRSGLVLASRAAGIEPPIDAAWLALDDAEGFRRSAERSRADGFQGKLCLHPDQVTVLHEVLGPSEAEIARARPIVEAFAASGEAALRLDGALIDYPVALRARRVLERAEEIAVRKNQPGRN